MSGEQGAKPLAVVTGAAVRLGRAIAEGLAQRGYVLGLHYNRSDLAAAELAELITAQGGEVLMLPADLTDPVQIQGMFVRIAESPYRLEVLVNSAAVMPRGRLGDMPVNAWDLTLDLNLRAPWLCAREAAQWMAAGGVIINITDAGVRSAWTGYPAYLVSKSALETLTRLLAKDLAPAIRVNAIAPGLILPSPDVPVETWDRLVERLPLQQPGLPSHIVKAVLFLIDNPYITGQTIVVDGGYQLK